MAAVKQFLALVLTLAVLNPFCCCMGNGAQPDGCGGADVPGPTCCSDPGAGETSGGNEGGAPVLPCRCGSQAKALPADSNDVPVAVGQGLVLPTPLLHRVTELVPTAPRPRDLVRGDRGSLANAPPARVGFSQVYCVYLI